VLIAVVLVVFLVDPSGKGTSPSLSTSPPPTATASGQTSSVPASTLGSTATAQPQFKGAAGLVRGRIFSVRCAGHGRRRRCRSAQGLGKAAIVLRSIARSAKSKSYRTRADSSGHYQIQVPAGAYMLSLVGRRAPEYRVFVLPQHETTAPSLVLIR